MSRSRRTIRRDSVFRTGNDDQDQVQQGLETADQPTRQTAVWLSEPELHWLDDQCQEIKRAGWRSVTRSALIRSLIRASMEKPLELAGVTGEAELADRIIEQS